MYINHSIRKRILIALLTTSVSLVGCGSSAYVNGTDNSTTATTPQPDTSATSDTSPSTENTTSDPSQDEVPPADPNVKGTRDNTPVCLTPTQPGTVQCGNDLVTIDSSNSSEGYISVSYKGSCSKVKMQITCPDTTVYTYRLHSGYEVFPLSTGSGSYDIHVFENIEGTQYSSAYHTVIDVSVDNQYGPYLYPNQYVNFKEGDDAVLKGADLAFSANDDLGVVSNVYNYVVNNIKYDSAFANEVESGYVPDPNTTLATGQGICLDYSSLMATMLRSQSIPTHMEVGYAGTAYHAWISVYLEETGWVNGIIEFNGTSWELMDPTFAASSSAEELKKFIGDGNNYLTKFIY